MYDSFNQLDNRKASVHLQSFSDRVMPSMADKEHGVLLGFIIASYSFIISTGAIPFRLIMRKNMGERAFSIFAFLVSLAFYISLGLILIWLGYLAMLGIKLDGAWFIPESLWQKYILSAILLMINPYSIFCLLFIQRGIKHYEQVLDLNRSGTYSYSRSLGESQYPQFKDDLIFWGFKVDQRLFRMIYQPRVVLEYCLPTAIGSFLLLRRVIFTVPDSSFITFLDYILAGVFSSSVAISISAICTSLDEFAKILHKRSAILDLIDGEVDMKMLIADKNSLLHKSDATSAKKGESNKSENIELSSFVAKVQ